MPEIRTDVLISGAGPNGLLLAIELALAGVRPLVLETHPEPSTEQKANGMIGQVVRLMDMRGLYPAAPPRPMPAYLFSGIPLPLGDVPDNPLHAWMISQPELTRLLVRRAEELDVDIRWGHTLTDFTDDDQAVLATVSNQSGTQRIRAGYLVGADGGKSFVRKHCGIGFPGFTATDRVARSGGVELPAELRTPDGGLRLPGYGTMHFGHNWTERGMIAVADLSGNRTILATTEFEADDPGDTPMTFEELLASAARVTGVDFPGVPATGPGAPRPRRIVGQNSRTADRYRQGRVFLVGDAAHVHSAMGGPGLNLGMQDALDLGWKLAAEINGWAPDGLLDTYESERRPLAERVMMQSMSQSALMARGPEVGALRALFGELLGDPGTVGRIAHLMAGSDLRYDTGCDHPLAGRLVPDLTVTIDGETRRVAELLRLGRPVFLDYTGDFAASAAPWAERVDIHSVDAPDDPAAALLIRPDGYVAWAGEDTRDLTGALTRWFGTPARAGIA